MGNARLRFRIECALAGLCALLAVSAIFWPDWVERLFGEAPDGGGGSFEWGMVMASALCSLAIALIARFEVGRLRERSHRG